MPLWNLVRCCSVQAGHYHLSSQVGFWAGTFACVTKRPLLLPNGNEHACVGSIGAGVALHNGRATATLDAAPADADAQLELNLLCCRDASLARLKPIRMNSLLLRYRAG